MEYMFYHLPHTIVERAKSAIARAAYPFIAPKVKDRVKSKLFQPMTDSGILEKIARRYIDEYYRSLSEYEKNNFCQNFWRSEAGTSWIEGKRKRYDKGEMQYFLQQVRAPFVAMVLDYLDRHIDCKLILEIGTGSGQLCFDLYKKLDDSYKLVGVDLNADSIAVNTKQAQMMGLWPRLQFECADAAGWFQAQASLDNVLVISVATLKLFTGSQVKAFLNSIKNNCKRASVALCEEVLSNFSQNGASQYTGTLGFSHNYPALFIQSGFKIKDVKLTHLKGDTTERRFLYALACL